MTVRLERRSSGYAAQFFLMTVPFLLLFIFFLWEAAKRPSAPIYNADDAVDDQTWNDLVDETGPQIALMDMVVCFLVSFGLLTTLAVYIIIFIPMRRKLMKMYLEEGQVVLGDVVYEDENRWCTYLLTKYAWVSYPHPQEGSSKMIHKQVRVYQYYTREQTTILCLPGKPYSGQPKSDVEFDVAGTDETRDKSRRITWIILAWMVFSFLGPIYILHQMSLIDDEDETKGWIVFGYTVGIIVPVVAIGVNLSRWLYRRYWLLHWCTVDAVQEGKADAPYHSMEAA